MQSRLAIVLMSAAGTAALFGIGFLLGLGVMSTPTPEHHKEIALTSTPTKVVRQETTGQSKHEDAKPAGDRALTPLTPVAPGGALAQATQKPDQPANDSAPAKPTQQAAAAAASAVAPGQPAAKDAPKPQDVKEAAKDTPKPVEAPTVKAEPAPATPNATPVSLERRNACDISACSRAYRSFRESDCTYQPFSGPRQLCTNPPGGTGASRSRDTRQASRNDDDEPSARIRVHRPGRDDELSSVVREVERITDGRRAHDDDERPLARRYHRDFTADGEDDGIEPADVDRGQRFFEGDDD
jgi:hypothetical protein